MYVKINTLHSLEDVKDAYVITDNLQIINTETGYVKKLWNNKGGYPCVTLEVKTPNTPGKNIPMHKIVALAFIENKESYDLIEHLNDNKSDYSINNLMFSNHSNNGKRAFKNKCVIRNEAVYKIVANDLTIHIGTMKELSKELNISRATLYDNIYIKRNPKKFISIEPYNV